MTQTRREKYREDTRDEILTIAWKQIGEAGAVGLSLRGIAREMGMTAPGLYRYYKDRNELVTTMLIDAFDSFSQTLETARDAYAAEDHAGRFRAICRAYFRWGAANPQKYILLFTTPIPGYEFTEEVIPSARRSFLVLLGVIREAQEAGRIAQEIAPDYLSKSLIDRYEELQKMGMPSTPPVIHLALSTWNNIHGMTSLFLQGYSLSFLKGQVNDFVETEIERMVKQLGLEKLMSH